MAIVRSTVVLGADATGGADWASDGLEMTEGVEVVSGGLETIEGAGLANDGLEIDSDGDGLLIDGLEIDMWDDDDDDACDPDDDVVPAACAPCAIAAESGGLTASANAKPIDQNDRAKRMKLSS